MSPFSSIFYFQELIRRPPRDIRCIVVGDRLVLQFIDTHLKMNGERTLPRRKS